MDPVNPRGEHLHDVIDDAIEHAGRDSIALTDHIHDAIRDCPVHTPGGEVAAPDLTLATLRGKLADLIEPDTLERAWPVIATHARQVHDTAWKAGMDHGRRT